MTECIGTFFWVLVLGLSVSAQYSHMAAISLGGVIMALVYMGQAVSGAHYNPAVTLAVLIRGGIDWKNAIFYVLMQIIGALLGALLTDLLVQDDSFVYLLGKAGSASGLQAMLVELFFTFGLVLVYLHVATGKTAIGNSYFGFAIGGMLAGAYYVGSDISGGAFNPAVGLAPNLLNANWGTLWIYLLGPFLGGALAALVYRIQFNLPIIRKKPQAEPSNTSLQEETRTQEERPSS